MTEKKRIGDRGEALAAQWYESSGYTVEARNFHTRQGELDVVAKQGELLVIAEVKTRTGTTFSLPREAVTPAKQQRLICAAAAYLAQTGWDGSVRFDVVEVVLDANGEASINCIENAFTL